MTFFDTAQLDGPFTNEELVGEALEPVRDQIVIATKLGFDLLGAGRESRLDSRPETIRSSVEGSPPKAMSSTSASPRSASRPSVERMRFSP